MYTECRLDTECMQNVVQYILKTKSRMYTECNMDTECRIYTELNTECMKNVLNTECIQNVVQNVLNTECIQNVEYTECKIVQKSMQNVYRR